MVRTLALVGLLATQSTAVFAARLAAPVVGDAYVVFRKRYLTRRGIDLLERLTELETDGRPTPDGRRRRRRDGP